MEILIMSPDSTENGYFLQDQKGNVITVGFKDILDKPVRFSELDGYLVLAHDEDEIPLEECVPFTTKNLNSSAVIRYLKERGGFNCIFAKIFGIYRQTDIKVISNKITIRK